MKKQSLITVQVKGKGDSKSKAFADALACVQRAVMNKTGDILLRIEPQDIVVIQAEEICIHEKFLFFFMPKEKKLYSLTLDVTVQITSIDTEKIQFTVRQG